MKFSVLLSDIKKQLDSLVNIAGSSPNKEDITQNILINITGNTLNFKATNYNIELKTIIPIEDVLSEGEITVNASKLRDTLSNLEVNSLLTFSLDDNQNILHISDGVTSFDIRTRTSIDFPSFEIDDITQEISLKQGELKKIIDSSIFCVTNEDFREYLRGIRFELTGSKLEVFTSDGHRMAIIELELENQVSADVTFGAILTKKFAVELSKILSDESDSLITLQFTKNAVLTNCNNFSLASKLITCSYPNVRNVIPKSIEKIVPIPRQNFNKLIQQVSVLTSKKIKGVTFSFENGKIDLNCENSEHEVAHASMVLPDLDYTVEISLNSQYVRDVLNSIATDNVLFCFSKPLAHILIRAADYDTSTIKISYIISKVVM